MNPDLFASSALLFVGLVGYLTAAVLYPAYAVLHKDSLARNGARALTSGALLHLAALVVKGLTLTEVPFTQLLEALSFFAMTMALLFGVLAPRLRIQSAGAVVAPLAFLMGVCAFVNLGKPSANQLSSAWLLVHVPVILLAYASFTLASAGAVLYLIHDQLLKRRRLHRFSRSLPPLETTDQRVFRLVVFGHPLLTLGILTGAAWFHVSGGALLRRGDPKILLSLLAWLVYTVYLGLRVFGSWRGRRANWLIVLGFCLVAVTFFGVHHRMRPDSATTVTRSKERPR